MNDITIPKHLLLNWLYSTDKAVSIDKLAAWLEHNTSGQYKLLRVVKPFNDTKALDNLIPHSKAS
jgi:hypothetical protein